MNVGLLVGLNLFAQLEEFLERPEDDFQAGPALRTGLSRVVMHAFLNHGVSGVSGAGENLGIDQGACGVHFDFIKNFSLIKLKRTVHIFDIQ